MGITFCLFAMPMLSNNDVDGATIEGLEDEIDGQELKMLNSNVALEWSTEALLEYLSNK